MDLKYIFDIKKKTSICFQGDEHILNHGDGFIYV